MEKRTTGTAQTRAKNKYNAKAYDQILVTLPKGEKHTIDAFVAAHSYKSRNEFIVAAIREKQKREQE